MKVVYCYGVKGETVVGGLAFSASYHTRNCLKLDSVIKEQFPMGLESPPVELLKLHLILQQFPGILFCLEGGKGDTSVEGRDV